MKNGTEYKTIYARAGGYYLNTCAERESDGEKAAAYDFITSIYSNVINSADNGLPKTPDVHFRPWEQQRERQGDVKIIRDAFKKIETLVAELYSIVENSEIDGDGFVLAKKISKNLSALLKLSNATIDGNLLRLPEKCALGLKELAEISKKNVIAITDGNFPDKEYLYFSRCVFSPADNWVAKAFDRGLSANGQLLRLCEQLESRGYKRVDCKDGKRISLDYIKSYGKDAPLKISWADKTHYGIELTFEDLRLEPYFIWLRLPSYKGVLENLGKYSQTVKNFIFENGKNCDGCRYCVQTDKTGTRPLANVKVDDKRKCTYFPSFNYNWRHLDEKLVDNFLSTLDEVYDKQ